MPKLTNLKVGEVSFCRKGMNQHARIALFKSADDKPLAIAKATFQEALDAQLVSQRVQNAFYGCFDNLWSRNDAFRTAMTDDLAAGGDGSVAAEAWVASVKELADNAVAAAKENGGKPTEEELSGAMEKAVGIYLAKKEQTTMFKFTTKAALQAAIAKFNPTTSPVQELVDIHDSATQLGELAMLPVEGPLAKKAPESGDVAALQATVARLTKSATLTGDVRKHYDTLADDAARDAFLAKDAAGQQAEVDSKNNADPVVHKCADGLEIRKSDGATVLALAKARDADQAEIAKLRAAAGSSEIEKAQAKFPHVAKAHVERLMKSVAGGTAEDKAGVEETLTAMNKAAKPAFTSMGYGGGQSVETDLNKAEPIAKMDSIVERIAKERSISKAAATVLAANDPEFQEAYRNSVANQLPVAE